MASAITKARVKELLQKNVTMQIIDIRLRQEYEKGCIPNTMNIPLDELQEHVSGFQTDDLIIFVCNHGKERSQSAAENFSLQGFKNVFYLKGGVSDWQMQ